MRAVACLILLMAASVCAFAGPIEDLSSPDQATRDAAAKILRATYKPPPRAKWEPLLAALKPGITVPAFTAQVARYIPAYKSFLFAGHASRFSSALCRLDCGWSVACLFDIRAQPPVLISATLIGDLQALNVDPPRTFTGTWTVYYANGQKDIEAQIRNGQYSGTATGYTTDGTLNWLGRYDNGTCTDENYYYPSGRIKTRTLHTVQSDFITYYRDNGSIASTETQPNDGAAHPELPRALN